MRRTCISLIWICFAAFLSFSGKPGKGIYQNGWTDFNKNGKKDIYEDVRRPIEERVEDLLRQMTLEEKTCQLTTLYGYGAFLKDRLPSPSWKDSVWKDGIANIDEQLTGLRKDTLYAYPYSAHAEAINTIQRWFIEETRLGIPVDFTTEGIRGLNHMKATYFPSQLAQASSFDRELVKNIGEVTAKEAKALGYTNIYSPILDVASDPRWGRIEETYGSDPFLVGQLGKQAVLAIQGQGLISTVKHFAVYGVPVGGRDGGVRTDPHVAPREMWNLYLEPFRVAVQEGKAKGVMASYNDYDGIPIISSSYFLTDILRKQFGFSGYVTSDSHAVEDLFEKYQVAQDTADAAGQVLRAGLNVRTEFQNPADYIRGMRRGIRNGSIPMSVVDARVREVLRVKFEQGFFEHPYVEEPRQADTLVHQTEAKNLALRAAHEGIVLLKNEGALLPLEKNRLKTVALIGPNVKEEKSLLSRYGPTHTKVTTVYEGVRKALPESVNIAYASGCAHVDPHFPASDVEEFPLSIEEERLLEEAIQTAQKADVILLAMGDNGETVGESHSRLALKLPGRQEELVKRIAALHKPTVLILVGGRPATVLFANQHLPAILETWYLGEYTGAAIADVLFGNYNPSGKLPVPFPKSVGQIPLSFPMKPAADAPGDANVSGFLYPFGYGLSYTTFEYENLQLDTSSYRKEGKIRAHFTVSNTGATAGDEIAQLYVRDEQSSVTTYVLNLRGFERVHLAPRETKEVTMELHDRDFSLLDREMNRVVEPGWFKIFVGASSEDLRLTQRIQLNSKSINK